MTESMKTLHQNDRVRLKPFEDNPEEFGIILALDEDLATVVLEKAYLERGDDGLREVGYDQLEKVAR